MLQTKAIINYLLGKLSSEKEDEFLAQCFSSDENAEKFERVRDNLIENYLRERLSKEDKLQFEKHFLKDPHNQELVAFSRNLRGYLADNKTLEAVVKTSVKKKPFLPVSVLVPVAAMGMLLLGVFFVWKISTGRSGGEIAEIKPTPAPTSAPQITPSVTISSTPSINPTPTVKTSETPKNIPTPTPEITGKPTLAFVLPLIGKGNDSDKTLKIERQTKQISLLTDRPFKEFSGYNVRIFKEGESQPEFSQDYEKFSTNNRGQIIINVPAEKFQSGNYRFIISGVNRGEEPQELKGTERFFTVKR